MSKEQLSKHKYIFSAYVNDADEIHIERFPVAYINEKYVYYIQGKKQRLLEVKRDRVFESVECLIEMNRSKKRQLYYGIGYSYFWCISNNPDETIRILRESVKSQKRISKIENARRLVESAETGLRVATEHLKRVLEENGGE